MSQIDGVWNTDPDLDRLERQREGELDTDFFGGVDNDGGHVAGRHRHASDGESHPVTICTGGDDARSPLPSTAVVARSSGRLEPSVQKIPLRAHDGSVRAYAIVDASDFAWLNQWRWCLRKGYAVRSERRPNERQRWYSIHRVILGLGHGDPRQGEHENRNRLDCRRSNLRIAERGAADNRQNLGVRADNTSGFRGVSWHKPTQRWQALARLDGKKRHLGFFDTAEEADTVVKAWRAEHMPFSSDAKSYLQAEARASGGHDTASAGVDRSEGKAAPSQLRDALEVGARPPRQGQPGYVLTRGYMSDVAEGPTPDFTRLIPRWTTEALSLRYQNADGTIIEVSEGIYRRASKLASAHRRGRRP